MMQLLRLTPRGHEASTSPHWRIDVDADGRLWRREDAFGNIIHTLYVSTARRRAVTVTRRTARSRPPTRLAWCAARSSASRTSSSCATTPLTAARRRARRLRATTWRRRAATDPLPQLHALMDAIHERGDASTPTPTDAARPPARPSRSGAGVCQDLTHIFIAAARRLGIPARYVSGYLAPRRRRVSRKPPTPGPRR